MKGTTAIGSMEHAINLALKELADMTSEDFTKELEAHRCGDVHQLIKFAEDIDSERNNVNRAISSMEQES